MYSCICTGLVIGLVLLSLHVNNVVFVVVVVVVAAAPAAAYYCIPFLICKGLHTEYRGDRRLT